MNLTKIINKIKPLYLKIFVVFLSIVAQIVGYLLILNHLSGSRYQLLATICYGFVLGCYTITAIYEINLYVFNRQFEQDLTYFVNLATSHVEKLEAQLDKKPGKTINSTEYREPEIELVMWLAYSGVLAGSPKEKKELLNLKFLEADSFVKKFNGSVNLNSISVVGQTVEICIPNNKFDEIRNGLIELGFILESYPETLDNKHNLN